MGRAAQQHVGLHADFTHFVHRVLGGFGFLFTAGDLRNQGDMDRDDVFPAMLVNHLPGGLQEGNRFDVADGSADLHDGHVDPRLFADGDDPLFDPVGYMRNYLNGTPQVAAFPLPLDDLLVNLAGGD
jgi:hypothetical protein